MTNNLLFQNNKEEKSCVLQGVKIVLTHRSLREKMRRWKLVILLGMSHMACWYRFSWLESSFFLLFLRLSFPVPMEHYIERP